MITPTNFLFLTFAFAFVSAQTALEQRTTIPNDGFKYDFAGSAPTNGEGGVIRTVNAKAWSPLKGSNIAFSLVTLKPCGINLPHVHPRANEVLYMISGRDLQTAFAEENPSNRTVVNILKAGDITIFPMGLIHFQQNYACEDVTFMTSLDNDDPGTMTIASHLFDLPTEAVASALNVNASQVTSLKKSLPKNPGIGREECLARCQNSTTPTSAQSNTNSSMPTTMHPNTTKSLRDGY